MNTEAKLTAFKTPHGTVNVAIQNCPAEVATVLWRFDIWKSNGRFEWDGKDTKGKPIIWFECPIEFLEFVESSMGRAAFQRMGVSIFEITH